MKSKLPDFVAIKKPGDDFYTWYDRSTFRIGPPPPLPDNCQSMTFGPSGKLLFGEDGSVAEIWTEILL